MINNGFTIPCRLLRQKYQGWESCRFRFGSCSNRCSATAMANVSEKRISSALRNGMGKNLMKGMSPLSFPGCFYRTLPEFPFSSISRRCAMQWLPKAVLTLRQLEPIVSVDLIIDHSVQVDRSGTPDSYLFNLEIEFERNRERYEFLNWGQEGFKTFRVVPPGIGICHQVNLEYLGSIVLEKTYRVKRVFFILIL